MNENSLVFKEFCLEQRNNENYTNVDKPYWHFILLKGNEVLSCFSKNFKMNYSDNSDTTALCPKEIL